LIEMDASEARFAQRHERILLDRGAPILCLGVADHLTRITDSLQIASDDLIEGRSFGASDLDETISRLCERRIDDTGSDVVRRNGLEVSASRERVATPRADTADKAIAPAAAFGQARSSGFARPVRST
jgi:hypothetical protein